MPGRPYIVGIVFFWMATATWLFQREFWPALQPGEPPPFNVDLVDEARQMPIQWTIHRGPEEEKIGFATTRMWPFAAPPAIFSRGDGCQPASRLAKTSDFVELKVGQC